MNGVLFLSASLGATHVHAGWEYTETARPKARAGVKSRAVAPAAPSEEAENSVVPAERVQVFGAGSERPAPEMSAEDYTKMIAEDAAANGESTARAETVAPELDVDAEFESLRTRLHTRQVAENSAENETDAPVARPSRKLAAPARAAPARVAAPPMETEVITPQKPVGKKVKGGSVHSASEPEAPRGNEANAAFPYTHLLPSPFTIPQGSWIFGTTFAYGLFDFLQISTNAARLIQGHWNVQGKVPLVDFPTFLASAFVNYEAYNPHSIDDTNPDFWLKRWQPGLVTAYELNPDMAFFLGGNFNFGYDPVPVVTTSGYLHGAQLNAEWSWMYNPESSRLGGNALSVGVNYDLTYSMFGFGFTHHWRTFELGVHYTFADRDRFLPIFGFTAGTSF